MMNDYIKEIDASWVIEVIAERFNHSSLNNVTVDALVYGGAVRDALAGLPLIGDLDIVASPQESRLIASLFGKSYKWTGVRNKPRTKVDFPNFPSSPKKIEPIPAPERHNRHIGEYESHLIEKTAKKYVSKNKYTEIPTVKNVMTYETINGIQVQIISAKSYEDVYNTVRNVDIVCCGVAMNGDGHVYELVEGAHKDCQDRILNVNHNSLGIVSIERLINRIDDFIKRGWKSNIDIKKLIKEQKKLGKSKKHMKETSEAEELSISGNLEQQKKREEGKKKLFEEFYSTSKYYKEQKQRLNEAMAEIRNPSTKSKKTPSNDEEKPIYI